MIFVHSVPVADPAPCPACGMALGEVKQGGKVGCPECYRHFAPRLASYIRRVHGIAAHTGRIPASAGERLFQKRRLAELRHSLKEAIDRQEFERCAELRDEIAQLEGKEGQA